MLTAYPALCLRLLVDDARIDLIEARVDLAVRFGALVDSSWAARRLCAPQWLICAARRICR
jgi:DNA-binding transcriptional LysR family regulator